ncbi:YqiA/YcfP family alpha/beta fold hydrolase [Psychrobacter sp. FDAARGOS_221]|uniref:YqiA/YcfP family alpha/beta fold hydrolase n=1 Tax=Psychrobacter sp. FDAARGOS_221 TaxID=1975705 RepID=UPI000BB59D59|nr:YqiA/YcfP family alpha/beta fold hydrolase [Psychrobacter sp. FDAARGOS_221]PNK60891.1 hypothetical protein A6J60_008380 [Psychrobacter sp. FDAARGOS_221]
MKIIYVHGLDSSANSVKGVLLERYCQQHHPEIEVIRPDLNQSPDEVFSYLCDLVQQAKALDDKVMLMGSSLGGYFSSIVSSQTGCPAYLLNPSTQPHISLQRFIDDLPETDAEQLADKVIYRTSGGWEIKLQHLHWFDSHQLTSINQPHQVAALIKEGDELLDPSIATAFYRQQGFEVTLQPGGDHRMTDFEQQLPLIMKQVQTLFN